MKIENHLSCSNSTINVCLLRVEHEAIVGRAAWSIFQYARRVKLDERELTLEHQRLTQPVCFSIREGRCKNVFCYAATLIEFTIRQFKASYFLLCVGRCDRV